MKRALISVFHKDGIVEFAQALIELGFTIYASGGTFDHLKKNGVAATPVSQLVGGEAILGHRVVTLSREVHAGLLAKNTPEDLAELAKLTIPLLDLVCVDLYPLEAEIANPQHTRQSVIEKTDIGGPTMIRSGVKGGRVVVCDPKDRERVIEWIKAGEPESGFVEQLAAKGEFTVARYVMASARYLSGGEYEGFFGARVATCKYGENAWQASAALYSSGSDDPLALDKFRVVEGTPPSYNNYVDIERLLQTLTHIGAGFTAHLGKAIAIAVVVKHGNACGAAVGEHWVDVTERMMQGDTLASFGGLVMMNFPVDARVAEKLSQQKFDGIIAPSISQDAIEMLERKKGKCRFIVNPALQDHYDLLDHSSRFRQVRGGALGQPNYEFVLNLRDERGVKYGTATPQQESDMLLAWAVGSTSNSNTITLVKDSRLIGNAVGQQDRVGAAQLAIARATRRRSETDPGHDVRGAVAYSDSFFPFRDGPQALIDAGISAIFTTSGSLKDQQTIDLCAKHNVALFMIPDSVGRGFFGH